ncbi:hypothetical protein BGZ61DRAFT_448771 [Ilyonectria robusta]|uniref:uncharacterized protein n=1 Tax=Ilyonectria robusta TaxID=1079257 RepID=UPI001E8CCE90|nr:uncharacterized protein BGZ61DRAFT_448771 [Ilyonectria robusta]KAH6977069.1 hypothetical protein BKA56DRAFT_587586 [Ilyonectria sp. MPI-CAGE-AT-0026]KAH8714277.1 hypothetical protein BGZ61DRAFT_448771 [Ilyonectria robusta]
MWQRVATRYCRAGARVVASFLPSVPRPTSESRLRQHHHRIHTQGRQSHLVGARLGLARQKPARAEDKRTLRRPSPGSSH